MPFLPRRLLARISHTLSAADADCGPSASLRSFGLLDGGSTTPSSASLRAPRIRAALCVLATRGCQKCGLVVAASNLIHEHLHRAHHASRVVIVEVEPEHQPIFRVEALAHLLCDLLGRSDEGVVRGAADLFFV